MSTTKILHERLGGYDAITAVAQGGMLKR